MIGAGMVGQTAHLANFATLPGCRVVALAELRPQLGKAAAARYGVPRIYPSHHELLADREVDAVVVVTRRAATGPIVRDALEAGKHVLSEKPMAHTVDQAEYLVSIARRSGTRYAVGYMKRHDAGVQAARDFISEVQQSGIYGRPILMRAFCFNGSFQRGQPEFVMTDEPRPEGIELWPLAPMWIPAHQRSEYAAFLNVFIHNLNLIRFLSGRTPRVTAVDFSRTNGKIAVLDTGDYPCALEMGEVPFAEWHEGVDLYFEKGRLRVEMPPPMLQGAIASIGFISTLGANDPAFPRLQASWSFRRQAEAFIQDIELQREPIASGADAIDDLRIAEQMWSIHLRTPKLSSLSDCTPTERICRTTEV